MCVCKREQLILKRKQSLVPQMKVAAMLGISQSQYSNIENGYVNPSEDIASKLVEMFDLDADYFEVNAGKEQNDGREPNQGTSDAAQTVSD